MPLESGTPLKHYRIVGLLGRGGMGEVYAAEDTRLGRTVAIKILPAALANDAERLRRFTQEAKTASALNHPSILTIYDIDEVDGQPFLVMEFIEGRTLRERMRTRSASRHGETLEPLNEGQLPLREAVEIAAEVASALAAAHAAGIVHRDVKPENIMLRDDGHAKLVDFGLAKIAQDAASTTAETAIAGVQTTAGLVLGTTAYMSPEQARGLAVDARSDIFSLGVVLYEMTAGRPPFQGETPSDVIASILRVDPPAIEGLPTELEHILRKTLEKDTDERHQTARDLAADLKRLRRRLDHAPAASTPAGQNAAASTTIFAGNSSVASAPAPSVTTASDVGAAGTPRRGWLILASVVALVAIGVLTSAWRGDLTRWFGNAVDANRTAGVPNFEGMTIEKVTGLGQVEDPVISPDGKLLAYFKSEAAENTIWLRQMATGSVVKVVGPTPNVIQNGQFSPDGNFIYYNERPPTRPFRYTLMAVPAFGGTPREIAEGRFGRVSFSSDGTRLAAVRESPTVWDVVVMNADGSGTPAVIASRSKSDLAFTSLAWSPAGDELAVLAVERIAGGFDHHIHFIKPDGTAIRRVTPSGTPAPQLREIVWTASRDALVALGSRANAAAQILLIRSSDGHVEPVTNDASAYTSISFSPTSGVIASLQQTGLGSISIGPAERLEEAKELPGRLTDNDAANGLSWLNDRELVLTRGSADPALWMVKDDFTGARRLTENSVNFDPRTGGDGRLVLFGRMVGDLPQVFRLVLPEGRVTQVTHGNGAVAGAPSPDGRLVYFREIDQTPPAQVLSMPIDGGPVTPVFEAPMIFDHAVSPDGTQIAVIVNAGVGTPRSIALVPSGVGTSRTVFTTGASIDHVRWYPSGGALLIRMIDGGQSSIYRLDVKSGALRRLTSASQGTVVYASVSPDGRRIAYRRSLAEWEIVLLKPKTN